MSNATPVSWWPENVGQIPQSPSPLELLKPQAEILSDRTSGTVVVDMRAEKNASDGRFIDNCYLFGPEINYRYLLFSVRHPIEFYPAEILSYVEIIYDDREPAVIVENDNEFTEEIKRIFNARRTSEVIAAIIARSK